MELEEYFVHRIPRVLFLKRYTDCHLIIFEFIYEPLLTAIGCCWLWVRLVNRLICVRVPLARRSWAVNVRSRSDQISRVSSKSKSLQFDTRPPRKRYQYKIIIKRLFLRPNRGSWEPPRRILIVELSIIGAGNSGNTVCEFVIC